MCLLNLVQLFLNMKTEKIDVNDPPDQSFVCTVCQNFFATYVTLDIHIRNTHEKKIKHICTICDKILLTKAGLIYHMKTHSAKKCKTCDELFPEKHRLLIHIQTNKICGAPYSCDECGARIFKDNLMNAHKLEHKINSGMELSEEDMKLQQKLQEKKLHENKIKNVKNELIRNHVCALCTKSFPTNLGLTNHQRRSHENNVKEETECSTCGKVFSRPSRLREHQRAHLVVKEKPFACDICTHKFVDIKQLNRHVKVVHDKERKMCMECGMNLSPASLRTHMKFVHEGAEHPKRLCSICNKTFDQSTIKKHEAKCSQIQQTSQTGPSNDLQKFLASSKQCNICGKKLNRSGLLKRHIQAHMKVKPFPCTRCEKKFADKSNLVKHLKHNHNVIEGSDISFACSRCTISFDKKRTLELHGIEEHGASYHFTCSCGEQFVKTNFDINIARHRKICPFRVSSLYCEPCDKQFGNRKDLTLHKTRMHQDKEDTCEECGQTFSNQVELKLHMMFHSVTVVYCKTCCLPFTSQNSLQHHMKTHTMYKISTEEQLNKLQADNAEPLEENSFKSEETNAKPEETSATQEGRLSHDMKPEKPFLNIKVEGYVKLHEAAT